MKIRIRSTRLDDIQTSLLRLQRLARCLKLKLYVVCLEWHVMWKPAFDVSDQMTFKQACPATETIARFVELESRLVCVALIENIYTMYM